MKGKLLFINCALMVLSIAGIVCYDRWGGIGLKAANSAVFMLLGLMNTFCASKAKWIKPRLLILLALAFCMAGDIALYFSFIPGAMIFAAGHVCYFAAFCGLEKLRKRDFIPGLFLFAATALLILLLPAFEFGSGLMKGVCLAYALIISMMVGKAASNMLRRRNAANLLIAAGSVMFCISDLMLLFYLFAGGPPITDTICLYTYFPGQCMLAHAVYHLPAKEA